MEDKIFDILTDLLRKDITKTESIDKLLILHSVSISALLIKAEQMQRENDEMVKIAKSNWEKEYKTAIGIGINRIVRLIKRH